MYTNLEAVAVRARPGLSDVSAVVLHHFFRVDCISPLSIVGGLSARLERGGVQGIFTIWIQVMSHRRLRHDHSSSLSITARTPTGSDVLSFSAAGRPTIGVLSALREVKEPFLALSSRRVA